MRKQKSELVQLTLNSSSFSSAHAQLDLIQFSSGSAYDPLDLV